jgi:hypothetical protein
MRRASYFTPIYFFTSVLPSCGKTNSLANLAIFLNGQGLKVAILDFAALSSDHKLLKAFPTSIQVQEYDPLSELVQNEGPRFQKNFFFIETDFISYFPVDKKEDLTFLFADTAFKDFLLQLQSTFDVILANVEAGKEHCLKISEILSIRRLWHGISPISAIFSNSTPQGMVAIDELLRSSSAFNYQLKENTIILFNQLMEKYSEEANSDTVTASEIRKLFNLPFSYIIPKNIDLDLTTQSLAKVLDPQSPAHQIISALYRIISNTTTNFTKNAMVKRTIYHECNDGAIFDEVSPYLEKLLSIANSRLFTTSSKAEIYLEESESSYAIRLRISQIQDSNLGIYNDKSQAVKFSKSFHFSPKHFTHRHHDITATNLEHSQEETYFEQTLTPNSIYSFDDARCYVLPKQILQPRFVVSKEKINISPILFKHSLGFSDIPTLANLLGMPKKQNVKFKKPSFSQGKYSYSIGGIIPFEIPAMMPQYFETVSHEKGTYKFKAPKFDGLSGFETLSEVLKISQRFKDPAWLGAVRPEGIEKTVENLPKRELEIEGIKIAGPMEVNFCQLSPVVDHGLEEIEQLFGKVDPASAHLEPSFEIPELFCDLTISALEFGNLVEKELVGWSRLVNLDLAPVQRELCLQPEFSGVEIVYGGESRVTSLKMHYEPAEITVRKKAIIRRVTNTNKNILFFKPPLVEYIPPASKLFVAQSLAFGLYNALGAHFTIGVKPIKLRQISYSALLGPALPIKWLDSYRPSLEVELRAKKQPSDFIFNYEFFDKEFVISHSLIEDSAYLERELELESAVNYSFNKMLKPHVKKEVLEVKGVNKVGVDARFASKRNEINHESALVVADFYVKDELFELEKLLSNEIREKNKRKISTRNMLVLATVKGELSTFIEQKHGFNLQVNNIYFAKLSLLLGQTSLYEQFLMDNYKLKALDSIECLKTTVDSAFAGMTYLYKPVNMVGSEVQMDSLAFASEENLEMFTGQKPNWVPSLEIKDDEFAKNREFMGLTLGQKGYEPQVESREQAMAYRSLFPQIGGIKGLSRQREEILKIAPKIAWGGAFQLYDEMVTIKSDFDVNTKHGKYLFQIPLRIQAYKMSAEPPPLGIKPCDLLENLSSAISYRQKSNLHFIKHELKGEGFVAGETPIKTELEPNGLLKIEELKRYVERNLSPESKIASTTVRGAYGIKKIDRLELLRWARRTSSNLSAKRKVASYDNQGT